MEVFAIAALTVLASAVGTIAGFGMSAIMIPVLALFFPFSVVLLLVGVIHWVASLWKTLVFRKGLRPQITLRFGIPAAVASALGAFIVFAVSEEVLFRAFGGFLVGYVLFLYLKPGFIIPRNPATLMAGGALSGFSSGALGIGGSIRSAFLSAYKLPRSSYLVATGVTGLLIDTGRIVIYTTQGVNLSPKLFVGMLVFIPATLVGTLLGKKLVLKVSEAHFRGVVAGFLFVAGLYFIVLPW